MAGGPKRQGFVPDHIGEVERAVEMGEELSAARRFPFQRGAKLFGIERNKDKYTRLMDVLGYIESGYVMLQEDAPFTNDFIAECEAFSADDSHMHDDQVDPMMDAINDMLATNNVINLWERMT